MIDKLFGNAEVRENSDLIRDYLIPGEEVLLSFKSFRDEVVFTTEGIHMIDVQGKTGKKKRINFFPKKNLEYVSYETAGTVDMDVELEIYVRSHEPIELKIAKRNQELVEKIVKIMKIHYFS